MKRQLSKQHRRTIVFWFFCVIALPFGTLLIAYASGYRFQRETSSIIQTAALRITTHPKKVFVERNGIRQEQHTPYFDDAIVPGTIRIALKKEGHAQWEKELNFEAGKSHIFSDVILFKEATPTPVSHEEPSSQPPPPSFIPLSASYQSLLQEQGIAQVQQFQMLEGPAILLAASRHGLLIILPDRTGSSWEERLVLDGVVVTAAWFQNEQLLIATEHELWRYDMRTRRHELLRRETNKIFDATWHPDGNYIFYSTNDAIHALELDDRDTRQQWNLTTISQATALAVTSNGEHVRFTSENQRFDLQLY